MNAGRLRQRLIIQSPQYVADGAGGKKLTGWGDVATVRAEVKAAAGGEAFAQGIARSTQFYRIAIRFRTDVTPAERLVWNGVTLNIRTCADPDGRREELAITAESGAADG